MCHKGLLYLQKIVWKSFSANRKSHTVVEKLEHTEMACMFIIMDVREETSAKNLYFHKESD